MTDTRRGLPAGTGSAVDLGEGGAASLPFRCDSASRAPRAGCCGDPGDCSEIGRLGHCFGRTPMGIGQIAAWRDRTALCVCERWMIEHDVPDVRCPQHGLATFLRETFGVDA